MTELPETTKKTITFSNGHTMCVTRNKVASYFDQQYIPLVKRKDYKVNLMKIVYKWTDVWMDIYTPQGLLLYIEVATIHVGEDEIKKAKAKLFLL